MSKRGIKGSLAGLFLWAGSSAWADAAIPAPASSHDPAVVTTPAPDSQADSAAPFPPSAKPPAAKAPKANGAGSAAAIPSKTVLADAYIAQNMLRVYLDRPSAVTVYNSSGRQVAHVDSRRALETFPLQGITTGFIYLTVRTAQGELTRKLVYTGK